MNETDLVSIVKVLGPRLEPTFKIRGYANKGPCFNWLANIACGTTWDTSMEALSKEETERRKNELIPFLELNK